MEEAFSVVKSIRIWTLGALATLAVGLSVVPGGLRAQQPTTPQAPRHIDPQARQALDRVIQVLGGQAFLNARSLTSKGRVFFFQDGAIVGVEPFQSWFLYPDKRRFSYGKEKPVILINDGDKGWELDRYGLIEQPPTQLTKWTVENRYRLENLLRQRINDPGVLIQMGSVDFVDNVPTQGILITEAGGINVRLDLSRQTSLPTRISYRVRNVKDNDWDNYSDTYADYHSIDGVQVPMQITRYLYGERIGVISRNSAKLNEDYPPAYFKPE